MEEELVELFESGSALIVGSVDESGVPTASRAWGVDVSQTPAGTTLRVIVPGGDPRLLANLASTGRMAVTATHLESLRSAQAKGCVRSITEAGEEARARAGRYVCALLAGLEEVDGTPPAVAGRLVPNGFAVVVMEVDDLFDQTPGPGAGRPIGGTIAADVNAAEPDGGGP